MHKLSCILKHGVMLLREEFRKNGLLGAGEDWKIKVYKSVGHS